MEIEEKLFVYDLDFDSLIFRLLHELRKTQPKLYDRTELPIIITTYLPAHQRVSCSGLRTNECSPLIAITGAVQFRFHGANSLWETRTRVWDTTP